MALGYCGKILRVNLTEGRVETQDFDQQTARKFIGGSGLATKLVWDETTATTDPLSPENPLIFMTGPLTGTAVPGSSRITVVSLSPLTGIRGESHAGGSWADELKRAGFDGVVIKGKAREPVYLWVNNGEARLVSASHLWGKDTYEVDDLLKKETDSRAKTLAIGQAGERLVKIACLIGDGRSEARAAARSGLGGVMGSKNLKAVVVRGNRKPGVSNSEGLKESVERNWAAKITRYDPRRRREIYEKSVLDRLSVWGGKDSYKNWREVGFEGFLQKAAVEIGSGEPLFCRGCRTSCSESAKVGEMRRTLAGAIFTIGSGCLIDDMQAINTAYHLCNRFGIDVKSTGAIISFAMECFEKGLITKDDTEGIELTWGNGEAMVAMVRKIGLREGFGAVLGEGVRRAAEIIGGHASEYAVHCKGLEFPNWDARTSNFRALGMATANLGADPYSLLAPVLGNSAIPELGIYERDAGEARFVIEGMGKTVANMQHFGSLVNSLVICLFSICNWMPHDQHVAPSSCLEWLNYTTGWDMDLKEFIDCGERIFNLQRMINVRRGISRKDDTLPPRFLTRKLKLHGGPIAGHVPPLGEMLGEYYSTRGWSEEGIPTRKKLVELGLEEAAESMGGVSPLKPDISG
ncbi:aldehyde ferredoxin oxidoreductase family protein [Chloroflexota bacterium]